MTTIEIVNPISQKGLGRELAARANIKDELNYVSIGCIVRNDDGTINRTVDVSVDCAADKDQNKVLQGTATFWGDPKSVGADYEPCYYYPFEYHFKKVGTHVIKFTVGTVHQIAQIVVSKTDARP